MHKFFSFLIIMSLLTISGPSFAASGIDSSEGVDLPINAGGNLVATMKTDGNAVFTKNVTATGGMQVGSVAAACSQTIAGMMRYNSKAIEFCNGTDWVKISTGSAATEPVTYKNCPATTFPNEVSLPPGTHLQTYTQTINLRYNEESGWEKEYRYYQCIDGQWMRTGGG